MEKSLPLASLTLGILSYCLLLLISQEAPMLSLGIMGVLSCAIIAISIEIIWNKFSQNINDAIPPSTTDDEVKASEYLAAEE